MLVAIVELTRRIAHHFAAEKAEANRHRWNQWVVRSCETAAMVLPGAEGGTKTNDEKSSKPTRRSGAPSGAPKRKRWARNWCV